MKKFKDLACLLSALVILSLAQQAHAEVFKCKNDSGAMVYQDHPCKNPSEQKVYQPPALGVTDAGVRGISEHGWVGPGRHGSSKPKCMGQDGQWYKYGDARCEADYEQKAAMAAEQKKIAAKQYLECASLRSKPESLIGMSLSDFRKTCVAEPDARNEDVSASGTKIQWVFRDYSMYIYTRNDLITYVQKR